MFQEHFEEASIAEKAHYDAEPVSELLRHVRSNELGSYYTIWRSIAERATLDEAGWLLFDIASSSADYLNRYHCTSALLVLMGTRAGREPADYTVAHRGADENLKRLRAELVARIGMPR